MTDGGGERGVDEELEDFGDNPERHEKREDTEEEVVDKGEDG